MKLTYTKAREMSLWAWDRARKTGSKPDFDEWLKKYGFTPVSMCGFCDFFMHDCERCPLYWKSARKERCSTFMHNILGGHDLPCSRNFWHWSYWSHRDNKKAKRWAEKMYQEILKTPKNLRKVKK
jgi:hypothetical protein